MRHGGKNTTIFILHICIEKGRFNGMSFMKRWVPNNFGPSMGEGDHISKDGELQLAAATESMGCAWSEEGRMGD